MKHKLATLFCIIALSSIANGETLARISGRITDTNGGYLSGVLVRVVQNCRGRLARQTKTNSFGFYSLLVDTECINIAVTPVSNRFIFTPSSAIFIFNTPSDLPINGVNFIGK